MALDKTINFGKVEVSTGYDASATSIVLKTGDGAKLPVTGNFNMVWWNSTDYPDPIDDPNREIVRVTARSTDTLTVTRGQESTSAATHNTAGKTYKMILGITSKMITDIDAGLLPTSTGGQLLYGGAGGAWSALNIGTANQVLKVNSGATAPEWGTVSGGQTLYEAIVAPSGGDYTTLGAALTAGKTRIFIRAGTYTESAITNSTANLTITGEGKDVVVINCSTNHLNFSGAGVTIENVNFNFTTGGLTVDGDDCIVRGTKLIRTGTSASQGLIRMNGSRALYTNNYSSEAVTSLSGTTRVQFNGGFGKIIGNHFTLAAPTSNFQTGYLFSGSRSSLVGNLFEVTGTGGADAPALNLQNMAVSGNSFRSNTVTGNLIYLAQCAFTANRIAADCRNDYAIRVVGIGSITGNHFEEVRCGIRVASIVNITGNFMRLVTGSTSNRGIDLVSGSNGSVISGNTFWASDTGELGAIRIDSVTGTEGIRITGNVFNANFDTRWFDTGNNTRDAIAEIDVPEAGALWQKKIVRMLNTSGGALADGDVVVFKNVAGANEVTTTTTANDDKVYGVATAAISNNARGWIQTRGQKAVVKVDGSGTNVAIGDYLTTHTTAGKAVKATTGQTAFAIALAAASTDTTILCQLIEPRQIN